jgi:hypothetical protein
MGNNPGGEHRLFEALRKNQIQFMERSQFLCIRHTFHLARRTFETLEKRVRRVSFAGSY